MRLARETLRRRRRPCPPSKSRNFSISHRGGLRDLGFSEISCTHPRNLPSSHHIDPPEQKIVKKLGGDTYDVQVLLGSLVDLIQACSRQSARWGSHFCRGEDTKPLGTLTGHSRVHVVGFRVPLPP